MSTETEYASDELPKLLYRYRSVTDENVNNLRFHKEYFSNLLSYNDPFEGRILPDFDGTPEEYKAYLRRIHAAQIPNVGRDAANRVLQDGIANIDRNSKTPEAWNKFVASFRNDIENDKNQFISGVGVLSMSERKDSILMYTHYAKAHSGYCLEFDTSKATGAFRETLRMNYRPDYPQFRLLDPRERPRQIEYMIFTKSKDWCYEKEWRAVRRSGPGPETYLPEMLSGVIFGARMSKSDRELLQGVVAGRAKLYQAKLREREFGLDVVPA